MSKGTTKQVRDIRYDSFKFQMNEFISSLLKVIMDSPEAGLF